MTRYPWDHRRRPVKPLLLYPKTWPPEGDHAVAEKWAAFTTLDSRYRIRWKPFFPRNAGSR